MSETRTPEARIRRMARKLALQKTEYGRSLNNKRVAKWKKAHPEQHSRMVQSRKKNRTPLWLTPDDFFLIDEIYHLAQIRTKITGINWEVDHIYPMHGELVSGLHIPINLRVITEHDNRVKHNKMINI